MTNKNRYLVTALTVAALLTILGAVGASSVAADRDSENTHFVMTCETRESDFYDWIENVLWKKQRRFQRNLDAAIDALVSNPTWTIRIADQTCAKDVMVKSRRESLYFMIDDAHSEGAGAIVYGR